MNSTTLTMRIPFDTLAYAKKLKNAGVSEEIAEVQAEALAEVISEGMATKQDIKDSELILRKDLDHLESNVEEFKKNIKKDLKELELRLTLRLGSLLTAGIIFLSVLIKMH